MLFLTKFPNLTNSLLLMLLGMIGIFVVMLVIMTTVFLLNRFAKDKKTGVQDKDVKETE